MSAPHVRKAFEAYAMLKIDGIEGESQDSKHVNEIDLLSYGWAEDQAVNRDSGRHSGDQIVGKVHMEDFRFTMRANKASPKLMLALHRGDPIKQAVLTVLRKGESMLQEYVTYKFTHVLISSYKTGSPTGKVSRPTEEIAFRFAQIEMEYRPETGGPLRVGYNQCEHRAV